MTQKINKADWKEFFDRISRDFLDWETSVQIMNRESGVQTLSDGLPFNGATYEDKLGRDVMEFSMGSGASNHQTHNIKCPVIVEFQRSGRGLGGTLDIEDNTGTKTLLNFKNPTPLAVEYVKSRLLVQG